MAGQWHRSEDQWDWKPVDESTVIQSLTYRADALKVMRNAIAKRRDIHTPDGFYSFTLSTGKPK